VVEVAEQHQVDQGRRSAIGPVLEVVQCRSVKAFVSLAAGGASGWSRSHLGNRDGWWPGEFSADVVGAFHWVVLGVQAFGHAWVAAVPSGRVELFSDLVQDAFEVLAPSARGGNPRRW
jgi:hypothetical protein